VNKYSNFPPPDSSSATNQLRSRRVVFVGKEVMDTILGWGVTIGWGLAIFSGRNVRGSYCPAKEGKRTATISPVFRLSNCFRPFYLTNCGLYYPETLPTGVPSGRSKRVTIGAKICSRLPIPIKNSGHIPDLNPSFHDRPGHKSGSNMVQVLCHFHRSVTSLQLPPTRP
jgi:hypothetical protein